MKIITKRRLSMWIPSLVAGATLLIAHAPAETRVAGKEQQQQQRGAPVAAKGAGGFERAHRALIDGDADALSALVAESERGRIAGVLETVKPMLEGVESFEISGFAILESYPPQTSAMITYLDDQGRQVKRVGTHGRYDTDDNWFFTLPSWRHDEDTEKALQKRFSRLVRAIAEHDSNALVQLVEHDQRQWAAALDLEENPPIEIGEHGMELKLRSIEQTFAHCNVYWLNADGERTDQSLYLPWVEIRGEWYADLDTLAYAEPPEDAGYQSPALAIRKGLEAVLAEDAEALARAVHPRHHHEVEAILARLTREHANAASFRIDHITVRDSLHEHAPHARTQVTFYDSDGNRLARTGIARAHSDGTNWYFLM